MINSNLNSRPNFIIDDTGKIVGYKTPGGADTVFPFIFERIVIDYTVHIRWGGTPNDQHTFKGTAIIDNQGNVTGFPHFSVELQMKFTYDYITTIDRVSIV